MSTAGSLLPFIAIGLVVAIAFGSYLAVQTITENNVRQALLEQQKARQVETTEHLADQIATDTRGAVKTLELLASHALLQRGELTGAQTTRILEETHAEISGFTRILNVGIIDANNIHVNNSEEQARSAIGLDRSDQEYVIETRKRLEPYVSSAFMSALNDYIVAVSVPIINQETGEYLGLVVTSFETTDFFDSFGSFQDSRIVAFDRRQVYIATTIPEFLGLEYWGEHVQTATRANPQLNAAYSALFSGEPTSALFVSAVTNDERFVSGYPVFYNGEQIMSVVITTPISTIYGQVDEILFAQKVQTTAMLAAVVGAVSILIIYLSKWNRTLTNKVGQRTAELESAYERLKDHEKLQREFINVAAHELRTPIQPMLGVTEFIENRLVGKDKTEISREETEMLSRNVKRLERLASELLEVARIEGGSMRLYTEPIDISEKIKMVVSESKSRLQGRDVSIIYQQPDVPIIVEGDRVRLFEVLTNLIDNAIKFTKRGSITISVQKGDEGKQVVVKVADTGTGIDPDIEPKLFNKFVTKSESGTGIGLFISKSIIEAHGGRIWGENNSGGGATFTFTLPLAAQVEQIQKSD